MMNPANTVRTSMKLFLAIMFTFIALQTQASGSSGSGGQHSYNLEKTVLFKKLLCDDCPYSQVSLNANNAPRLIKALRMIEKNVRHLTYSERQAVIQYLNRRYFHK